MNATYKVLEVTVDLEERRRITDRYNQEVNAFRDLDKQLHIQYCASMGMTPAQYWAVKTKAQIAKLLEMERVERLRARDTVIDLTDDLPFKKIKLI